MSQFRVEVVRIGTIEKHPNADTLSITSVQGNPVVFKSGGFVEGDLAVYIPIDSMVPVAREEFSFLTNKDKPREFERIKAKRLRGVFSMGMLVPVPFKPRPKWDYFGILDPSSYKEGEDLKDVLGVTKFEEEDEAPQTLKGNAFTHFYRKWTWKLFRAGSHARAKQYNNSHLQGPFPYYDLESARRYGHLLKLSEEVVITEKIHGQNGRIGWSVMNDTFLVASHGSYKDPEGDSNWATVARLFNLKEKLSHYPGIVVYGEIFGIGSNGKKIQHLTYNMTDIGFKVFDVYDLTTKTWFSHDSIVTLTQALGLETVPVLYRGPWLGLEAHMPLAEGKSTLADHILEGWVVRPVIERNVPHFGRLVLKYVGQGYLLSNTRTEKH